MNVLFISSGNKIDYQCDCLFHGLNCMDEVTVYTLNDYWYMYRGNTPEEISKQYGMGFTIANRIPIDRRHIHSFSEAKEKVQAHFYDLIVYGSIYRCDFLLSEALEKYASNQLVFIDGEDHDFSPFFYKSHKHYFRNQKDFLRKKRKARFLASKGQFFKRELREKDVLFFHPISFAVPSENIVEELPVKKVEMATIIPGEKSTYIYDNEKDYYLGYQDARFGMTFKKGGWDCLRHYEILSNGCIPYFPGLEKCPSTTMSNFPKKMVLETNLLYESHNYSESSYRDFVHALLSFTRSHLTTRNLAEYVLSFCK